MWTAEEMERCSIEARTFKAGDYITLRDGLKPDCWWVDEFYATAGRGPFVILEVAQNGGILFADATDPTMTPLKHRPTADLSTTGGWIYGHFFVRNNFLGLVHKAIQCNDLKNLKSEL